MLRLLVVDGADDAKRSACFGQARQQLADADAGDAGGDRLERPADVLGGVGLGVPQVEVAGCAAVEDQDDRLGFTRNLLRRLGRLPTVPEQTEAAAAPAFRKGRRDMAAGKGSFGGNSALAGPSNLSRFDSRRKGISAGQKHLLIVPILVDTPGRTR